MTGRARSSTLQWHAGDNVGLGKDYTLFSTIDGIVVYQKKADRSKVGGSPAALCWRFGAWLPGRQHPALCTFRVSSVAPILGARLFTSGAPGFTFLLRRRTRACCPSGRVQRAHELLTAPCLFAAAGVRVPAGVCQGPGSGDRNPHHGGQGGRQPQGQAARDLQAPRQQQREPRARGDGGGGGGAHAALKRVQQGVMEFCMSPCSWTCSSSRKAVIGESAGTVGAVLSPSLQLL